LVALKTKIEIMDLHYPVRIGCFEEERSKPQDIAFDIVIEFNALASCKSDQLDQTIDYMAIAQMVHEMTEKHVVKTLEKFSHICVEEMFKRFPTSEKIDFKIRKFSTMPNAAHVGFSLEATRS
jgi:dihydroneopterin aldolase